MGSMLSGLLGGGQSDAQAGQTAALQQARDAAHQYRPEAMQARLNLLNKASGAYQGMNNAMETMYGGRGPKVGGPSNAPPQQEPVRQPTFGGNPVPQQRQSKPSGGGFSLLDPLGIFGGL